VVVIEIDQFVFSRDM